MNMMAGWTEEECDDVLYIADNVGDSESYSKIKLAVRR